MLPDAGHIAVRILVTGAFNHFDHVSACIPMVSPYSDPEDQRLHYLVQKHNIHANNGSVCTLGVTTKSPCRNPLHHRCSKFFPKPLSRTNHFDDRGYAVYRRSTKADQFVVPYNRNVTLFWDGHANVEICTAVSCILYLCKYFNKRELRGEIHVTEKSDVGEDEIRNWLQGRYISASEALWHINHWRVHEMSPAVGTIHADLRERTEYINIQTGELTRKHTDVARYLKRHPRHGALTIEEYYVQNVVSDSLPSTVQRETIDPEDLDGFGYLVKARSRGTMLYRFNVQLPSNGESYYLQMILKHKAIQSLEDGRTHQQVVHPSFQSAALAMGLYRIETEYETAFQEAVQSYSFGPEELRQFLFQVTVEGAPGPLLMARYQSELADDLPLPRSYQQRSYAQRQEARGLLLLSRVHQIFRDNNKEAGNYGFVDETVLECPAGNVFDPAQQNDRFQQMTLSEEQREIVDFCTKAMGQPSGQTQVIFVDAPAGYGKTHVANAIAARLRSLRYNICCTATTALAAVLHEGGSTAHKAYGLPVDDSPHIECSLVAQRFWKSKGHYAHLWDEAPSCHAKNLEAVERMFRQLYDSRKLFGGLPLVILLGDFRQCAPVLRGSSEFQAQYVSIRLSELWQHVRTVRLTTNYRQSDGAYAEDVRKIGDATTAPCPPGVSLDPSVVERPGWSFVPLPCDVTYDVHRAIEHAYPIFFTEGRLSEEDLRHAAILCARNRHVDEINDILQNYVEAFRTDGHKILSLRSRDTKHKILDSESGGSNRENASRQQHSTRSSTA